MRRQAAGQADGLGILGRRTAAADRDASSTHPLRHYKLMQRQQEGRTPLGQSSLDLISCILGAGVLGFPYCFKACGTLLASVVMVLSLVACRFSYQLLLFCCQMSSKRSYEELAEQALGSVGRKLVEVCNAALNLGVMVAYLNILADVLSSVAGTIIPPGAEPSRSVYLAGVTIFGAFPVAMIVRDHQVVAAFSAATVGFILLFTLVIILFAAWPAPSLAAGHLALSSTQMWRPDGLLVSFPVMAFGFTAHPYYLGVYQNLQAASVKRMVTVTDMSMAISALVYWLVGVAGYLLFGSRTSGDLLRNFGAASAMGMRGGYERAIKLCFGLAILGAVPLGVLPFYNMVLPLFVGFDKDGAPTPRGAGDHNKKHHASDTEDEGHSRGGLSPGSRALSGQFSSMRDRDSHGSVHSGGGDDGRDTKGWSRLDVADLKLHHDTVHSPHLQGVNGDEPFANPLLHAGVTAVVLGVSMASALLIPNVEFIFGLTGATASVLISYILPALTFIRLLDSSPELSSGMHRQTKSGDYELHSKWLWRRRQAVCLLVFGIIAGITCTDAILGAVQEEAVVVQLAQQLAAHEAVVVETTRAQAKAMEAVATVSAVTSAGKQLGAAQANASDTLGKLQEAAQQLDLIAGKGEGAKAHVEGSAGEAGRPGGGAGAHGGGGGGGGILGGINELVKQHQQHATETKVLRHVSEALASVSQDVNKTFTSVEGVVRELDAAIAGLRAEEKVQANASALAVTAAAAAAAAAGAAEDAEAGVAGAGPGGEAGQADRVASLAVELGNALGVYSNVAGKVTSGQSLQQVRDNALSALQALNQTLAVLADVSHALEAAQSSHQAQDSDAVKAVAARAMQVALNATATSALAMQLTSEALQRSANKETDELISVLTRVTGDLQKAKAKQKKEREKDKDKEKEKEKDKEQGVVVQDGEVGKVGDHAGAKAEKQGEKQGGQQGEGLGENQGGDVGEKQGAKQGGTPGEREGKKQREKGGKQGTKAQAVVEGKQAAADKGPALAQGDKAKESGAVTVPPGVTQGGEHISPASGAHHGSDHPAPATKSPAASAGQAAKADVSPAAGAGAGGEAATQQQAGSQGGGVAVAKEKMESLQKVLQDLHDLTSDNATAAAVTDATATPSHVAAADGGEGGGGGSTQQQDKGQEGGAAGPSLDHGATAAAGPPKAEGQAAGHGHGTATSPVADTAGQATGSGSKGSDADSGTADKTQSAAGAAKDTKGKSGTTSPTPPQQQQQQQQPVVEVDLASQVKGALRDAVALTEGSKKAAMKDMQDTLSKANSKVQERIVDIVKDMKEVKKDAEAAAATTTAAMPPPVEAAADSPSATLSPAGDATAAGTKASQPDVKAGEPGPVSQAVPGTHTQPDGSKGAGASTHGSVVIAQQEGKATSDTATGAGTSPAVEVQVGRKMGVGSTLRV